MKKLFLLLLVNFSLLSGFAQKTNDREVSETVSISSEMDILPVFTSPVNNFIDKSIDGEIYNNGIVAGGSGIGGFVTDPGAGPGGSDYSTLFTTLGLNTFGAGFQITSTYSVADDFTVPANTIWTIDSIIVFGYQTGSTTIPTIDDLRLQIWSGGAPNAGGTVSYGDLVTNVLDEAYWTGVYRVSETTADENRPIMGLRVEMGTPLELPAGNYWVEYSAGGTLASGPWANPIAIVGVTTTGNALQNSSGVWNDFTDSGTGTPQGFPFIIYGHSTSYFSVSFNVEGANGSLSAKVDGIDITSGDVVEEAKNIEFTAHPVIGFKVKEWIVNAAVVTDHTELTYTLENLTEAVTVTVEFERDSDTELFNNGIEAGGSGIGGFVTNPVSGFNGYGVSALANTSLSMGTIGFSFYIPDYTIADEFTIPANSYWTIESLVFYGYQAGSTESSTINDLRMQIWDAAPNDGGTVIYGDLSTNILTNTSWTGVYRALETDLLNSDRPIMMIHALLGTPLVLEEGTYWIEVITTGSLAFGPYAPPITIFGETTTGNALQYNVGSTTWIDMNDSGTGTPQGLPFVIYGNATGLFTVDFNVVGGNGSLAALVDGIGITSGDIVEEGKNIAFIASPNTGYSVKEWRVDGVVVSGNTEELYTLENLSGDASVSVEFEEYITSVDHLTGALNIYPNPFNNAVIIDNAASLNRIVFTNIIGQTMLIAEIKSQNQQIINTNMLQEGAYMVTFYMETGEEYVKLMVKE